MANQAGIPASCLWGFGLSLLMESIPKGLFLPKSGSMSEDGTIYKEGKWSP